MVISFLQLTFEDTGTPWTQDVNWTYIRRLFTRLLDVFWTSYVRLIYILCPGGRSCAMLLSLYFFKSKQLESVNKNRMIDMAIIVFRNHLTRLIIIHFQKDCIQLAFWILLPSGSNVNSKIFAFWWKIRKLLSLTYHSSIY